MAYIARHDAQAAARIGDGLIDAAEKHLARFPLAGPACREYAEGNIRYWLHRGYRIVYEVDEAKGRVNVLRFWNCARGDWPTSLN